MRIWLNGGKAYCSVAITFDDGSGIVLPALQGYIGHITVADGGVSNVSYVPSDNSRRWSEYEKRRDDIKRLRSAVSAAAKLGTLRLRKKDATSLRSASESKAVRSKTRYVCSLCVR